MVGCLVKKDQNEESRELSSKIEKISFIKERYIKERNFIRSFSYTNFFNNYLCFT